ncbi:retrovirus-related pol polyprotein from transposon TNT 1-94 [Tanacetum coccineum]|uniref:Retrovirus-related pol polyprotein from transposon TNT 1-94 n=1 Tax=Tanacetum coccineum TaxID=301880 RepID=A0ABQ5CVE3_9ASTR
MMPSPASKEKFLSNVGVGRTDRPLVFRFRLLKTYDGESLMAHEFRKKVHRDRQFCDSDLEVAFRKHSCYVRTEDGVDLLKVFFHKNLVEKLLSKQNGVIERRNRTLVEAARTMLIFSKAPMFLWAEVVDIACYTQDRSLIHTRHNKTLYELVHDKKPNLKFLSVFGALCYPTNDSEYLR